MVQHGLREHLARIYCVANEIIFRGNISFAVEVQEAEWNSCGKLSGATGDLTCCMYLDGPFSLD